MSIRARIWCTLLLAVVLPVGVCLYLMSRISYDHAIRQSQQVHDERAKMNSQALETYLKERIYSDVDNLLSSGNFVLAVPSRPASDIWNGIEANRAATQPQWHNIESLQDPRIQWFSLGAPSQKFRFNQKSYPELSQMLMVDPEGVVIAGSYKPSAFDQNASEWLKTLRQNPSGMLVRWDQSNTNDDYSFNQLEVLVTMHQGLWTNKEAAPVAYVRLVLNFDLLLRGFLNSSAGQDFNGLMTASDGTILTATGPFTALNPYSNIGQPWRTAAHTRTPITGDQANGTAFLISHMPAHTASAGGDLDLQIFSGNTVDQVVGPLRARQWQLFGGTFAVIALGVTVSSMYMRTTISKPIEHMTRLTNEIMDHSQHGSVLDEAEVEDLVRPLRAVKTHDEIEMLAERFLRMSVKALGFQRRLEIEVAQKTHLIQSDLEMAREFQQALLPSRCPCCGNTPEIHDPLELDFAHFYQPAAYMSGDFYDYLRVDDHKVAVLIGDVMGHGARAALATAILRALVEEVALTHTEPGAFLSSLNQRYHEIIQRSGQMIFASACYLLFDTETGCVHGASAGHPTPLRARLGDLDIAHLFPVSQPRFPLGMLPNVNYKSTTAVIHPDDLILLYTDGVTEAESGDGEQFGEAALIAQIDSHRSRQASELVTDVANLVLAHSKGNMNDDVCMIAIRVLSAAA